MYNSAIQPLKSGGDEISFRKMGRVYKLVVLKYALSAVTYLSIIGRLVRVLKGLGVLHNGQIYSLRTLTILPTKDKYVTTV